MPRLQDLILRLGLASVGELNRAIFSCPESSLLAALEQTFGQERADEMRGQISKATGIPVLEDDAVKVTEDVLDVSALELTPLVTKFRALPIRRIEESGGDCLLLAMADPLIEEARQAFAHLFRIPVKAYLAREKAIMNAYALSAARLSLAARKEAAEHPEGNLPNYTKHIEDPEVRKAIHQLTATAVKHNASLVVIETTHAYTRAQFTFADGLSSSVDISVSPVLVLTSLFRRGQIVTEDAESIRASCRVRFKSVSVNFLMECVRTGEAPDADPLSDPMLSTYSVSLKSFVIDNPEHPGFWEGIHEGNASALHEMFEQPSGLFILAASKAPTREFALRALSETYPDTTVCEVAGRLVDRPDLFVQATERRVLAAVPLNDAIDVLKQLQDAPRERLASVRGIFGYYQMPRNCPFCSVHCVPETDVLLKMPSPISLVSKEFRAGKGCSVCEGRGILGFIGISSVLNLQGYAGKVLEAEGSASDVLDALSRDCFSPLLEDGLRAAGAGKVSLPMVLADVPRPPPEYFQARASHLNEPSRPVSLQNVVEAPAPVREPVKQPPRKLAVEEPLRGRDAFMGNSREVRKDEDSDWLFPALAPEDEPPKAKPEPAKAPSDGRALLLVIDDDADQRAILRRVFEIAGYKVEVAADGIDGIVSAVRLEPQLIIVDFMMPELDGRETIRRLKHGATTGAIPVVALTAYADPDVELGLLQAGADDFCPKSVSKQVLLKRVERLVRGRD